MGNERIDEPPDERVEEPAPSAVAHETAAPASGRLDRSLLARLQRSHGNAFVSGLVAEQARAAGPTLAPLRTAQQFKSDSTVRSGLVKYPRSDELARVDAALAAYDRVRRSGDLKARQDALYTLGGAIQSWKTSKQVDQDKLAWKGSIRGDEMEQLDKEQLAELDAVDKAIADAAQQEEDDRAEAKRDEMDRLISPDIEAINDPAAKARALFRVYLDEFRGKASYTTTTKKGVTIWDRSGSVACSMISNGLIDLLRHAGLSARLKELDAKNFVTKRLGEDFIDPNTEGNVRRPNRSFTDEKRFFFNKHWIVEVGDGVLHLDPTSGIEVAAGGDEVIEWRDFQGTAPEPIKNDSWQLQHIGSNRLGDGAYELTPVIAV